MKFTFIVALVVCLFSCQSVFSQVRTEEKKKTVTEQKGDTTITQSVTISKSEDITPRHHMIVVNPLKFLLFYNISYFQSLSPKVAVGVGVQSPTLGKINGYGFNVETRFHPSAKSLRGFYFAPNIAYNKLWDDDDDNDWGSTFSIGGLMGWQWFVGDDFALGLGLGVDYYFLSQSGDNDDISDFKGTFPVVRFDIGYAW